jgi:hypothetical protein
MDTISRGAVSKRACGAFHFGFEPARSPGLLFRGARAQLGLQLVHSFLRVSHFLLLDRHLALLVPQRGSAFSVRIFIGVDEKHLLVERVFALNFALADSSSEETAAASAGFAAAPGAALFAWPEAAAAAWSAGGGLAEASLADGACPTTLMAPGTLGRLSLSYTFAALV